MNKALATLGLTATTAALLAVTTGPATAETLAAPAIPSQFHAAPAELPAEIPAVPATTTARDLLDTTGLVVRADDVYYKNCTEARKAGAAPIKKGEPGYRPALDRDNDGVACE
ncbi:excalibur calcium-binding domain-containing protein [Nocardia sp. CDC160]|uniref:excalibur calcium-binding domain-containing protein n=1 Tax=Nocardia sp. CDC160 TaxID=3112166 RepID=UPI002DBFE3C3|nr:excalibur calcium-binding domain-containing protein [Nocardia sp. CDC160]MEC3915847.1 excalibur calcium-binding domain-containing protein [Nocardia sp. CDC160]